MVLTSCLPPNIRCFTNVENKECMNDTNFDDCEIDPSPELEDSEVDEDDDMASLRINLQNVLLEEEAGKFVGIN